MGGPEVLARLGGRPNGLTSAEADRRLESQESSMADAGCSRGLPAVAAETLAVALRLASSPLPPMLLLAGGAALLRGQLKDAAAIVLLAALAMGFAVRQELRSRRAAQTSLRAVACRVRVLRDRRLTETDGRQVVPGDVVVLSSGDMVPADMRLLHGVELLVNESIHGGAASSRKGSAAQEPGGAAIPANMLLAGSVVLAGRGHGVVVTARPHSLRDRLAAADPEAGLGVHAGLPPMLRELRAWGRRIGWAAAAAALALLALGWLLRLPGLLDAAQAVPLCLALLPEGLPAMGALALTTGIRRIQERGAVVRRPRAVEALGEATLLCADKAGLLTANELTVRAIFSGGAYYQVTGTGYTPNGHILPDGPGEIPVEIPPGSDLEMTLRIGLVCNEASLEWSAGRQRVKGDPTDGALLAAAIKGGLDPDAERAAWPVAALIPFEPHRGYMATLHHRDGERPRTLVFLKGSPEKLLYICSLDRPAAACGEADILAAAEAFARQGLKVIALGVKELPAGSSLDRLTQELTHGVAFQGLMAIIDPPRPEAAPAVAALARAGVRTVMVTGDHPSTAAAVAARLGIGADAAAPRPKVLGGLELAAMSDDRLDTALEGTAVLARATPRHKLRFAQGLMRRGEALAITGEAVEDIPAMAAAHLGVALGASGSQAAREAADLLLAQDDLGAFQSAVAEARAVHDNLRKAALALAAGSFGPLAAMLAGLAAGLPMPLTPTQLVWMELAGLALPAAALALEPAEPGVLDMPPRPVGQGLGGPLLWRRTVVLTSGLALGPLGICLWAQGLWTMGGDGALAQARAATLSGLMALLGLAAYAARSLRRPSLALGPWRNPALLGALGLSLAAQLAALFSPPLTALLDIAPLPPQALLALTIGAAAVLGVGELDKLAFQRQRAARSAAH